MPLIDLADAGFEIEIDLAYGRADNFAGRVLYAHPRCLLHPDAAGPLGVAARLARAQGLSLRIHDAFRPLSVQRILWEILPDPDFVADPAEGSTHNRGVALDLTLARPGGAALPMGTGFDEMVPASAHGVTDLPADAIRNRSLLAGIMAGAGFAPLATEWWHYNLPVPERWPVLTGDYGLL